MNALMLHGKKGIKGMMSAKVNIFSLGDYPGLSWWGQPNHTCP